MSETVTRDDADGVATLTLQRPGLTSALRTELMAAVAAVSADDSVRAVLLTGTGRAFCVGQDLGEHIESLRGNAATSLNVVVEEYNPLILALSALRVPVVVGINGACAGAGLGIALAGDLRIAAAGAKFTTAFTGIGLSSDSALAARLAQGPTSAFRAVKTVLATAATDSLEETLALEARLQEELGRTTDHREAVEAFLEKRPARFTGR